MENEQKILLALGRIEGRLEGFGRLYERVSSIEQTLAWLKGAWAVLTGAFAYVCHGIYQK